MLAVYMAGKSQESAVQHFHPLCQHFLMQPCAVLTDYRLQHMTHGEHGRKRCAKDLLTRTHTNCVIEALLSQYCNADIAEASMTMLTIWVGT